MKGDTASPPLRSETVVRRSRVSSRWIVPTFGLALLIGVVALYLVDPDGYVWLIRLWMPLPLRIPFADTSYVMAQLECWRAGVDVYASNPCDIMGRTQAYPPIWLRLWFLPASQQASISLALLLAVGFIVSLAVLPPVRRTPDIVLLLAAVASPVTGFAVERGNADLLIFILAACVVVSADRPLQGRLAGYAGIVLAAVLKLYPIGLLMLLARERFRVAVVVGLAGGSIWLACGWLWHDEMIHALANLPNPPYSYDGPGARKLAEGLIIIVTQTAERVTSVLGFGFAPKAPAPGAIRTLLATQLLAAAVFALMLARGMAFRAAFGALNSRESQCLITGASLFCVCFVSGVSVAYRDIFLLFVMPSLFRFIPTRVKAGSPLHVVARPERTMTWRGRCPGSTFNRFRISHAGGHGPTSLMPGFNPHRHGPVEPDHQRDKTHGVPFPQRVGVNPLARTVDRCQNPTPPGSIGPSGPAPEPRGNEDSPIVTIEPPPAAVADRKDEPGSIITCRGSNDGSKLRTIDVEPLIRWTPAMIVFLMWDTLFSRAIELTFGPLGEAGGPAPTFAFWLLCEILWWWVFVVLAAALLCFLGVPGYLAARRSVPDTV